MVLRKLGIGESTLFLVKEKGQTEDFYRKLAAGKRTFPRSKTRGS
jgi:predicted DNA-binding transcriptional regulator AlpA